MGLTHALADYNVKGASLHLIQANNEQQTVETGMRHVQTQHLGVQK